jgi:hypothetical protein
MGEQTGAQYPVPESLPDAMRLVNFTDHRVSVNAFDPSKADHPGADLGESPTPSRVVIAVDGRSARVDDKAVGLGEGWLNTGQGLVHVTPLRRSTRVRGLPPSQPGTRYLVSRLTAEAARDRGDLVFPFGEIRDGDGQITGVRGLASYRPRRAVRGRWQDHREAHLDRRSRKPLNKQYMTGVMFVTATALLSGALGLLPGVIDNARRHGWGGGGQFWTTWLTIAFGAGGCLLLFWAALRWRMRSVVLAARGTAYVIEEQAITWRHEEKASVLTAIEQEFAAVLRVPGPEALGENWRWQADVRGAPFWDTRADQLVRSFWAVHYNDDQVTRNAVFTWAPWPVAMAFGARATARRRGLVLHVRQRPSFGAGAPRQELRITEGAHDFLRDESLKPLRVAAPEHAVTLLSARLNVCFSSLPVHNENHLGWPDQRQTRTRRATAHEAGAERPLLLLVRFVHEPIDCIKLNLPETSGVTVHVADRLPGPQIPLRRRSIPVAEWRLDSTTSPVPPLPWDAFPAAALDIAEWVVAQTREHDADVVLLATRIPQELAVGLGIQLAQRASAWPAHLYPVYFTGGSLVIPGLALGATSVPAERP